MTNSDPSSLCCLPGCCCSAKQTMAPLEAMPWAESKMQDVEAKPSEEKVGGTLSWMVTLSQQSTQKSPYLP